MKNILFVLLSFSFFGQISLAQSPINLQQNQSFLKSDPRGNFACALLDNTVTCWGGIYGNSMVLAKGISSWDQMDVFSNGYCKIANQSVSCVYNPGQPKLEFQKTISHLKNPRQVKHKSGRYARVCVLDDDGIKCFGMIDPIFKNPRALSINGFSQTCALDINAIMCWQANSIISETTIIPDNSLVQVSSSSQDFVCGVTKDRKTKCWKKDYQGKWTPAVVPALNDTEKVFTSQPFGYYSRRQTCAIDQANLKCWIDEANEARVSDSVNPKQLVLLQGVKCVLDDEGVGCYYSEKSVDANGKEVYVEKRGEVTGLVNPRQISGNASDDYDYPGYFCVLDDEGIKCWSLVYNDLPNNKPAKRIFTEFKNPKSISVGDRHFCVQDDDGLSCHSFWNDVHRKYNYLGPHLKEFSAGQNGNTCAIYGENVQCWKFGYLQQDNEDVQDVSTTPHFKNPFKPLNLVLGADFNCAMGEKSQVKCWRNGMYGPSYSSVQAATDLSAATSYLCGLVNSSPICKILSSTEETAKSFEVVPSLVNVTQMATSDTHACALNNEGIHCWGPSIFSTPMLRNPKEIVAGMNFSCALEVYGIKCWGSHEKEKVLSVPQEFSNLISFNGIASLLNPVRAQFLSVILKEADKGSHGIFKYTAENYLLAALVRPSIFTSESTVVKNEVLPAVEKWQMYVGEKFGYQSLQDGLLKTPDNLETRKIAITAIQSVLMVSLNFLDINHKDIVQETLRAAGQASIDPMSKDKIQNMIVAVGQLTNEKQVLKQSLKTAFLVDCLDLAVSWLQEKVK